MPTETLPARLQGRGVSPGLVCAPVLQLVAAGTPVAEPGQESASAEGRLARVMEALDAVAGDMEVRAVSADPTAVEVLLMTAELARDPALRTAVAAHLAQGISAADALAAAVEEFCSQLTGLGGYLAERVVDLRDVRDRATAHLCGVVPATVPDPGHPFVLAAPDLSPADTATLGDQVIGILTELGGPTSHTAILARSLGIPAVVACAEATQVPEGAVVVLDGTTGVVELRPDDARREEVRRTAASPRPVRTGPGRTRDGQPVALLANIGTVADAERAARVDGEGVGLFRTEFVFLGRPDRPGVDEQAGLYRRVLELYDGRPVTVRTLDAGSDKPIDFLQMPPEDNPALGVRGHRLSSTDRTHLTDQLTALAEAQRATGARVKVMAPMISTAQEAREFAETAHAAGLTDVGVMIEVPAAAIRAADILDEVDFVSIGTNDLAQYAFAADRMVPALGHLLDPWQPALVDLVALVCTAARAAGKPVSVCGEAASDPLFAAVLAGLGVTALSMAAPALAAVRDQLAVLSLGSCQELAATARAAATASESRQAVSELARASG
jgi:phosphotransferase system enzyme I (PtsI)